MKLAIKNLSITSKLSEETLCFSATIYADGQKVGEVTNRGNGGCNSYHWQDRTRGAEVEAWADAQDTEFDFERLDQIVGGLVADEEQRRYMKRLCSNKTLFRLTDGTYKDGEWLVLKARFNRAVHDNLKATYGDRLGRIANLEN